MKKALIAAGALFALLLLLALLAGRRSLEQNVRPAAATSTAIAPSTAPAAADPPSETRQPSGSYQGFLYGRITTIDGVVYEGRLRWGQGEEAFWGDYFNGVKNGNPWAAHVPVERLPKERHRFEIFGLRIAEHERRTDLGRRFMVRFGDIARIEAQGRRDVRVTLKNGSVFGLDRFESSDFDDGVRLWDAKGGALDFDTSQIRTIELLPTPSAGDAPYRLHGTVHTKHGEFTGFIQWDREECVGTDKLDGRTPDGDRSVQFDTIRSIARRPAGDGSLVTLLDGREIALSDTNDVGFGNRGICVDDSRYGGVLISWDVFERVDFDAVGSGPAYGDFPPGRPLSGRVTTRAGASLAGRLVFDLDESETVETLDAPDEGVDYTIPFGMITSIVPRGGEEPAALRARVTLQNREELQLTPAADLGEKNAGILVFVEGGERPEYVPWADVAQIDLDRQR